MKHWFLRKSFYPRNIPEDEAWQSLTKSGYKVYRFLCKRSYLTQNSPTRRYCEWTYRQIAKETGVSFRQVNRVMKRLMETNLVRRWYAGDSGSSRPGGSPRPPRYEIPASIGQVSWWRRGEKAKKRGKNGSLRR